MRQAQFIAAEATSREPSSSPRRTGRGFLARVVEVIYRARRVQAERTLERYRHLIGQVQRNILRELKARSEKRECIRE